MPRIDTLIAMATKTPLTALLTALLSALFAVFIAAVALPAAAQEPKHVPGFALDIAPAEAIRASGAEIWADLASGQDRQVSFASICRHGDSLAVVGPMPVTTNKYFSLLLRRGETGFSILEPGDPEPDFAKEILAELVMRVSCAEELANLRVGEDVLIPIVDVLGETTLSGLATRATTIAAVAASDAPTATEAPDPWTIREEKDAITDQPGVFVSTISATPTVDSFRNLSYPKLLMRCARNTTSLFVIFDQYEVNNPGLKSEAS